ncbi:winged helix-turn-helix domain-containing protein [Moorella sp. ACPs]|uniref:winged helix-turn-helix domain-containing protein n=1 Tax=Neomoorella carbonis TaxID=3062783 RepID=UPI003872BF0B
MDCLQRNDKLTQREIALRTGLSASCAADLAGIDGRNTMIITWQAGEEYQPPPGIEGVNIIDRL